MSYSKPHHLAQMEAREIYESLVRAGVTEGITRAHHTEEALKAFGKLSAHIHTLTLNETKEAA